MKAIVGFTVDPVLSLWLQEEMSWMLSLKDLKKIKRSYFVKDARVNRCPFFAKNVE
jgi:hypothetical protein